MSKKKWLKPVIIVFSVIVLLIVVFITTMGILSAKGYSLSIGRCLVANGDYLLVVGDTPIYMSGDDKYFEELQTGDKLIVLHDGVDESYPAYTGVKYLLKYGSGDTEGLDEILNSFSSTVNTLKLSFELDNQTHNYTIEYDSEGNIISVDNTDYYEFLEDGELITNAFVLDTELTDYFQKNGGYGGIVEDDITLSNATSPYDDWGLTMNVVFHSNTEFDVAFGHNSDSMTVDGELTTSHAYEIQVIYEDEILSLGEYYRDVLWYDYFDVEIGWDDELYTISQDKETVYSENLQYTYGELPSGTYRISKTVTLTTASGEQSTRTYTAEFAVVD